MSIAVEKKTLEDQKLVLCLLRRKLITDGQLKAAMDYQRSLGGGIPDILVKLDLVRPAQIEEALRNPDGSETPVEAAAPDGAIDPAAVQPSDLRIHRKLLDKLPPDLVDKYLIVLFFPVQSIAARKIVMGHGRKIPKELPDKVRSVLGVDLCTLALGEETAKDLLVRDMHGEVERTPAGRPKTELRMEAPRPADRGSIRVPIQEMRPELEARTDPIDSTEILLAALLGILLRKGVITREELELEIEVGAR